MKLTGSFLDSLSDLGVGNTDMTQRKCQTTVKCCILRCLFGLSMIIGACSGCAPSGMGSVSFPSDATARTVGAPPKPKPGLDPRTARPAPPRKTPPTFIPG